MDMKSRMTRPSNVPKQTASAAAPAPRQEVSSTPPTYKKKDKIKKKRAKWPFVVIAIVMVIAICVAGYFWRNHSGIASQISSDKYQAVFLTNGQVYFGKLEKVGGGYYKLKDVYYLQNKSNESEDSDGQLKSGNDVELIKLGNEVHGPEDTMVIERSQVLFFENLKKDGKVSTTIQNYQKG